MREYKTFTEKEVSMKFYQQSMVTGNPIKVKPNLYLTFGFTINTNVYDLKELERVVQSTLLNLDLVLVSNTRKEFKEQGGTPMYSLELVFIDKDSEKSTLQF